MKFFPATCIGVLLAWTFHLFSYATFYTDDFNNLYWVQQQSAAQMAWHVLNPASKFFRPVGMMVYWLLLRFADLNALAYHLVAWFLHVGNTALVYVLLKRVTGTRPGSVVGAMLFASHAAFADIYWNFGTIFELVSASAMFAGLLLWMSERRSWPHVILLSLLYLFAIKAKEMALVLPALWLACEFLLRRKWTRRVFAHLAPSVVVGFWYGLIRFGEMRNPSVEHLYYMDIRWITLGRAHGGYFNSLFGLDFRWQIWSITFVVLLLLFVWRRNRAAVFFLLYVLIAFLPVIFLVNHRETYLWYIPSLGVWGLAALLTGVIADLAKRWVSPRVLTAAAYVLLPLMCWGTYLLQERGSEERRAWQMPMSKEYRAFVLGLRAVPPPPSGETLFFDSHPIYFDAEALRVATQVALRRTDIDVQLVKEFPTSARYRLHFQDSVLTRIP